YAEESVGLAAGRMAVRFVNHLVEPDPTFDFVPEFGKLVLLAERSAFGPSTQALLDEAALRDIPYIRLNEQSLVQLGHGIYQKRIRATMTSQTSSLGVDIASDKKRSEEHTSELQSRVDHVCRLLLEKKKHTYRRSAGVPARKRGNLFGGRRRERRALHRCRDDGWPEQRYGEVPYSP